MIALDDFVSSDPREALVPLADIVKVEMQLTTEQQRTELMKRFGHLHCRMLAEKVESHEEFVRAQAQGFVYFQGYFFRRPEMLSTRELPANRVNYLRMLQEVSRPELDLDMLERLIKADASVCYRLLRYLNSAVFGFKKEIHSVKHALSLLGARCPEMGTPGGSRGRRTRQTKRSGPVCAGSRALWRASSASLPARPIGPVPDGSAVFD